MRSNQVNLEESSFWPRELLNLCGRRLCFQIGRQNMTKGTHSACVVAGCAFQLADRNLQMAPTQFAWLQAVLSNWRTEFDKWAPGMRVVVYDGGPEERKQLRADVVDRGAFTVLITHYDLAIRDKSALKKVSCATAPLS